MYFVNKASATSDPVQDPAERTGRDSCVAGKRLLSSNGSAGFVFTAESQYLHSGSPYSHTPWTQCRTELCRAPWIAGYWI